MLTIHTLTLGAYRVNCYIVSPAGSDRCVVIDPGYEPERILAFLQKNSLQLDAILLTHGHFDHVGGAKALAEKIGCPVFLRSEEKTLPEQITAGPLDATEEYPAEFTMAGIDFLVLHTPGHTPGSVCLLAEDTMFSGDTLFAGSCGRVDFPGGSGYEMFRSLTRLKELPGNYRVLPGHGEETTLDDERRFNPYMQSSRLL